MKRQILIISILLFISTIIKANELVIEVTTDQYANETSWTLFDTEKNVIIVNGSLEKQTTYRDTIQLDASLCYYWTIYDSYGNGMSNGTPPGDYKVYFDGNLVAECADPNFGDSISVHGLGSNCLEYDVSVDELTFNSTQAFTPFDFTFNILNFGSSVINTLDVVYSIDGIDSETIVLDGLSIEFGQSVELSLPEKIQITEAGTYVMGIQVLKINGEDDGNTNNNSLIKNIEVKDGFWKTPMHEIFTASTCPPCKSGNEILDGVLELYNPTLYSLVKYQTNFPGYGDPYYTKDVGRMMGLYSVSSVPSLYVNLGGQYPHDYTVEKFENYLALLSEIGLEINVKAIGDSVFVNISIMSEKTQSSDLLIRLAVVEKITYDNIGSNGETEFHNVHMKFLSDWEGDRIGVLEAGKDVNLSYAESMFDTFVEEMDDLRVVAYVFKNNIYTILQSDMVDVPYSPAAPYVLFNIENESVAVDTLTTIEIISDKALQNIDGSEITDLTSVVSFIINDASEEQVPFTGTISTDNKTITIVPDNQLKANTNYSVELSGVQSNEGVEVVNAVTSFTTVKAVDINENPFNSFEIYPNPANDFITIKTGNNGIITIMDVAGKTIYTQSVQLGETIIDISNINSGLYLIKSEIRGKNNVIKFSKN